MRLTRGYKNRRHALWPGTWLEVLLSTILMPSAQFSLDTPWAPRVQCTDASLSGHGRAWAIMPTHVVQDLARLSDTHGCYTNLNLADGIGLDKAEACPLKRVHVPIRRFRWFVCGRRATPENIALGECDASNWGLEDRLHRPLEFGTRSVNPMDSSVAVGAFGKGRSPNRKINARCRRRCAILVAGCMDSFSPWLGGGEPG